MLKEGLHTICPEAGFYGEEGERQRKYELEWIVDPLDGTTNYLSGFDQFTISVALVKEGEVATRCCISSDHRRIFHGGSWAGCPA